MKRNYLLWALCCLFFAPAMYAQPHLFTGDPAYGYDALDDQQKAIYNQLVPQRDGVEAYIMQYNPDAVFEEEGYVRFDIGLPRIDSLIFKMTWTGYTSDEQFSWAGEYYDIGRGAAISYSRLSLSRYYDTISGGIDLPGGSYRFGFLGSGQYVLYGPVMGIDGGGVPLSHDVDSVRFFPLTGSGLSPGSPVHYCSGRDSLKILFVFTQQAAQLLANGIPVYADEAVAALNRSFDNSGIYRQAYLAKALVLPVLNDNIINLDVPYEWQITKQVDDKLRNFMFHPAVQAQRAHYKADVVLLCNRDMGGGIGLASGIGSNFDSAYAGLVPYDGDNITPAHEIGHLLGCQHDTANAAPGSPVPYNHGYHFTGADDGQQYYTLMAYRSANNQQQLERFSSPDTSHMGTVTGTPGLYDNTRRVKEWLPQVAGYYSDEHAFGVGVQVSGTVHKACRTTGTAAVVLPQGCNYGPYTYQWSYSDNGFSWHTIPGSNTPAVPTEVTPASNAVPLSFQTRLYRVKVSTAAGFSVYGIGHAVYSCVAPLTQLSARGTMPAAGLTAPMLEVYPNPAAGSFKVGCRLPAADEVQIDIYDMLGRKLQPIYQGYLEKGRYNFKVQASLSKGYYQLILRGKTINLAKPLVID